MSKTKHKFYLPTYPNYFSGLPVAALDAFRVSDTDIKPHVIRFDSKVGSGATLYKLDVRVLYSRKSFDGVWKSDHHG